MFFWFPSAQGRRNERAEGHQKKSETVRKRSAAQKEKSPVQKKRNFRLPRNERAGWREP